MWLCPQAQEQAQAEMAAALKAEEMQVQEQEWNMAELERIQEQQVSRSVMITACNNKPRQGSLCQYGALFSLSFWLLQ